MLPEGLRTEIRTVLHCRSKNARQRTDIAPQWGSDFGIIPPDHMVDELDETHARSPKPVQQATDIPSLRITSCKSNAEQTQN